VKTLRQWFHEFTVATGEHVQTITLRWEDTYWIEWDELPTGVVPFDSLTPGILDAPFDDGFGENESPNLCAWSPSWVVFSDNYDGAERLCWVPRIPLAHEPIRPGGG
jgi:hypothetical protein